MKRGTTRHPKVYLAAEKLKVRRPVVLGYLDLLWEFAGDYAPSGDIGRYPDSRIEGACDWHGKPGVLIEALLHAGWIEHHPTSRLVIHDWLDHCERSVIKKLERAAERNHKDTDKVGTDSRPRGQLLESSRARGTALPLPLPLPLPKATTAAAESATPPSAERGHEAPPAKTKPRPDPPGYHTDELYARFRAEYRDWAPHVLEEDFQRVAWHKWKILDGEHKLARLTALGEMTRTRDPAFAPAPANFIETEWRRPPRPAAKPKIFDIMAGT